MYTIPSSDFLALMNDRGIGVNARYAHNWPRNIELHTCDQTSYYWVPVLDETDSVTQADRFWHAFLPIFGQGQPIYFWPRSPSLFDILERDDVPAGWQRVHAEGEQGAAILFGPADMALLQRLLLIVSIHAGDVWEDVYLVPTNPRVLAMTDHHNAVHVDFSSATVREAFLAEMTAAGYPLPKEAPDWTFKSKPDGTPNTQSP